MLLWINWNQFGPRISTYPGLTLSIFHCLATYISPWFRNQSKSGRNRLLQPSYRPSSCCKNRSHGNTVSLGPAARITKIWGLDKQNYCWFVRELRRCLFQTFWRQGETTRPSWFFMQDDNFYMNVLNNRRWGIMQIISLYN